RSDPCLNPPLLDERRGFWSDRHGVTERYPTLASSGRAFDPGDCAAHGLVAEHDPQIPAIRRGGTPFPGAGTAEQARCLCPAAVGLAEDGSKQAAQAEAHDQAVARRPDEPRL